MKKLLCVSLFLFCVVLLNIVSLDLVGEVKKYGVVNKVDAFSQDEPTNEESIYCAPFYIFDGLKNVDVKVVGKTIYATMSKSNIQKLLFTLDARTIKTENSAKYIIDMYSPRLNSVEPITINKQAVNMQICVNGDNVQIGIPSLCGYV